MTNRRLSDDEKDSAVYVLPRNSESEYGYDEIKSEEQIEFDKFKDEMADASTYAKIMVARKPTDRYGNVQGRQVFQLFECGLEDYTFSQLFSRIRDQYGTGLYQIQGRDKEGKIRFNRTVGIEAPKIKGDEPEHGGTLGHVIQQFNSAMNEQHDRIRDMMQGSHSQGGSMVEMITAIALLMKELRPDQGTVQPPKTLIESLTEMKLVRELVGDLGNNEGSGVDNFWGAIAEVAKGFGGPLLQAIALAKEQGKLDEHGVIRPQLTAPETGPKQAEAMNVEQSREHLKFLLAQAEENVPVKTVVEFVLDQLPEDDDVYTSLEDFLLKENCIEQAAMLVPKIREYREWFENYRTAMLAELASMADATEAQDTETLTGEDDSGEDADKLQAGDEKRGSRDATEPTAAPSSDPDGDSERKARNVSDP